MPRARRHNRVELIALLDEVFASRPLAEWATRFDAEDVWWAPVQSLAEVVADPQASAAGAFVDVATADGSTTRAVAGPVSFDGPRARSGRYRRSVRTLAKCSSRQASLPTRSTAVEAASATANAASRAR